MIRKLTQTLRGDRRSEETEKYLAQQEMFRSGCQRVYINQQFEWINDQINALAKLFKPSGSNGQLQPFLDAVDKFFKDNNISADSYWNDVWMANGKRSLGGYNKPKMGVIV
jgi:hypothetical protein